MACRYPAKAEAQRKRWADPAYRENGIAVRKAHWREPAFRDRMAAAGFKPLTADDHRKTPGKWSRLGVPTGFTRTSAAAALVEAEEQADAAIRALEAQGLLEATALPDREEGLAKAALRELFVIAIAPGNASTKLRARNLLLAWTKAKPIERKAIIKSKIGRAHV